MNRWWARSDSGSSRASSFGLCEMVHPVTLGCLDDEPELATKGAGLFRRLPVSIYRREPDADWPSCIAKKQDVPVFRPVHCRVPCGGSQ